MTHPDLPLAVPGGQPEIITSGYQISARAFEELAQRLEQRGLRIPIKQIQGFAQFAPVISTIPTDENTNSTVYTNLTTVGPQVTNLPPGKYVLQYGCFFGANAGATTYYYSPKFDANEALDANAITSTNLANVASVTGVLLVTLSDDNNTITMRYRTSAAVVVHFSKRWLYVVRYDNP